jgi:hypothetical protein
MQDHPDYFVPPYNKDVELQPNYFCRARNIKREKYCRARAGQGTEHLGQGRCKNHGGSTPVKHGRYSTVIGGSLGETLDQLELEEEKDQLDVMPEARLLRGITIDAGERWNKIINALVAWNEAEQAEAAAMERRPKLHNLPDLAQLADLAKKTAEIVNMIHKQRSADAIKLADFYRLMAAMAETVNNNLDKLERFVPVEIIDRTKAQIEEDWRKIKLKA